MGKTAFIVQDDGSKNLSPVFKYAEDVVSCSDSNFPLFNRKKQKSHIREIRDKLKKFDPNNDYVLLVGDPINIGIVFNFVIQKGGGQFLKWDRQNQFYIVLDLRKENYCNGQEKDNSCIEV